MTLDFCIEGIGLCGPALNGWAASRDVLAGTAPYRYAAAVIEAPALLPAAERRRATLTTKLALNVAAAAVTQSGRDPATLASVFTSSGGDGETVHAILETLATAERDVSPTRFHNSVHNAPSGYWNIAVRSHEPATSLCAYDHSFITGLIEAVVQMRQANSPILLVSYDLSYPAPLQHIRPLSCLFGVALVLAPAVTDQSLAKVALDPDVEAVVTVSPDAGLDILRSGNPSARSLPLLMSLARNTAASVVLATFSGQAALTVTPVAARHV